METNLSQITDDVSSADRPVLFVCDEWNETQEGLRSVNRALALSLTGYKGVQVKTHYQHQLRKLHDWVQKNAFY